MNLQYKGEFYLPSDFQTLEDYLTKNQKGLAFNMNYQQYPMHFKNEFIINTIPHEFIHEIQIIFNDAETILSIRL